MRASDLSDFGVFMKPKEQQKKINKRIIGYTRVSSKKQQDNYSLEEQERDLREYAKNNGYDLDDEIIGGTYESASGDFSRKEFIKLLDEVKKSKNKPFAIAIKFINRFSRTGAGAISIVYELVEKMNVHLIETSSGLCTENLKDRSLIYRKLLEANEENQKRLELTLPGMKTFLENGNWLGVAPFGYTTYGKKVKDYTHIREEQNIVINDDGKVLKDAWQWKLQGERDFVIIQMMAERGVKITKQKLSNIWRNPFYAGVLINKLIDAPVNGRWEPMVSHQDFLKVNNLIKPLEQVKYDVGSFNNQRPLARFLICKQCGRPLTGYEVKSKGVHYYKCNTKTCTAVSFNANTTRKSSTEGLNDSFNELLSKIELRPEFIEPLKMQVIKMFDYLNGETKESYKSIISKNKELMMNLEKLEEKFLFGGYDDTEKFNAFKSNFKDEIQKNNQKIAELENKLSNHSEYLDFAISASQNLSKYWASNDYPVKDRIQRTVFPKGLVIDPKNRTYLTKNMNELFVLIRSISTDTEGVEMKKASKNTGLSLEVAGVGLEPTAFGL